jgi:hypothetical protein
MAERPTVTSRREKSAEAIVGSSIAAPKDRTRRSARRLSMWEALRQMPARAGRSSVGRGEASSDLGSDEADRPRQANRTQGNLNSSNRPVRTRMPGGVAGERSLKIAPYADWVSS